MSAVARNVHLLSADCRSAFHSACSGRRYVGATNKYGHPEYGRCQCACHRTESALKRTTPECTCFWPVNGRDRHRSDCAVLSPPTPEGGSGE